MTGLTFAVHLVGQRVTPSSTRYAPSTLTRRGATDDPRIELPERIEAVSNRDRG
ncbi:hypothetical protein ACFX43_12885 [Nocardioides sp. YIM B13467]|uniref:hypothetical protein n=1 Tax=Nocardioides sp. YIM B13467 TaxID=3366294 RepID=UPI00366C8B14